MRRLRQAATSSVVYAMSLKHAILGKALLIHMPIHIDFTTPLYANSSTPQKRCKSLESNQRRLT